MLLHIKVTTNKNILWSFVFTLINVQFHLHQKPLLHLPECCTQCNFVSHIFSRVMETIMPLCTWHTKLNLSHASLTFYFLPAAQSTTFKITTPYALYICPEGQKVTLTCKLSGSLASHHDSIYKFWYFSNQGDQSCSQKKHVRNVSAKELHHESEKHSGQRVSHHGLEFSSDHHGTFYVTMANLTLKDSGNYCCYMVEAEKEHNKAHAKQQAHGFMELRIQKGRWTLYTKQI